MGVYQLFVHLTPQTVSRVTHTTPRHLSDAFQTNPPQTISRITHKTQDTAQTSATQPTDTPKWDTQWPSQGHQQGISQLQLKQYSVFLHWSSNNWFGMITLQAVFRVTQTTSRHLLDTLRHLPDNPNLLILAFWRALVRIIFFLMTLDWPLGVCWVLGRFLGGVLGCMSDSGYCLGWVGVWCEIDWHKSNQSYFHQMVPSLPGASECLKVVWKVSERCLGVVCVTLDTVWGARCASK